MVCEGRLLSAIILANVSLYCLHNIKRPKIKIINHLFYYTFLKNPKNTKNPFSSTNFIFFIYPIINMALNRASYKIYKFFFFFQINLERKKKKQRFYRFNYFNALFVYYVSNKRVYKRKTGVLFLLFSFFFPQKQTSY